MLQAERIALRRRYAEERDKRLRPDGNDQYLEFTGRFSRLLDDPYAPRAERDPKRDHVTVAFVGGGLTSSAPSGGFSSDAGATLDAGSAPSAGGSVTAEASIATGAATRSGISLTAKRSCLVAIGPSDRWRRFISSRVSGRVK